MPRCRSRPGLTLVEVAIVLLVMSILAGVAISSGSGNLTGQLQATAAVLAGELARARSLAVTNNSTYRVTLDLTNNQFYLEYSGGNTALSTLPSTAYYSGSDSATRQYTSLGNLPCSGGNVRLAAMGTSGSSIAATTQVEFGNFGQTTQTDETQIWLSAGVGGSQRYQWIRVNPVTGLATVEPAQTSAPPAGMMVTGS